MLLPPFTALEVGGTRIDGAVVVVELRPTLSSAMAASGIRTGKDDVAEFARQRAMIRQDKHAAHARSSPGEMGPPIAC